MVENTGRTSDNNTLDGLHDGLNLFLMKDVKGSVGVEKKMGWEGMEEQRQRREERNEMWRIG